jgi:hypothetical protein
MAERSITGWLESNCRRARSVLATANPSAELAEASVVCALGHLVEQIWNFEGAVGELSGIATVLQRLIASYQQLDELHRRSDGRTSPVAEEGGMAESALLRIEERLRLL